MGTTSLSICTETATRPVTMEAIQQYLPQSHAGYLPYWQLLVAVTAAGNTLSCLLSTAAARKLYAKANVTPLQSRTFGVWTLLAAAVRLAAAYDITNKSVYALAFTSYVLAWAHFVSEIAIFRTARVNSAIISPFIVSCEWGTVYTLEL